jgi:hypothetical protein
MTESAATVAKRAARRAVRALTEMRKGYLLSGDDSGLVNVWKEICVQVQLQESVFWDAYDRTVWDIIYWDVKNLPQPVLTTLWLETIPGEDWLCDQDEQVGAVPYCVEDVVEHVKGILYSMAGDWSNRRIQAYLNRR